MAKNAPSGDGHRIGAVKQRVQFLNPITKLWAKVDTVTGRILDNKQNGEPFKGVAKK